MSAWVDIKFAPKDGTVVDLWLHPSISPAGWREPECVWLRWMLGERVDREGWWSTIRHSWVASHSGPTHYSLPLPGPNT